MALSDNWLFGFPKSKTKQWQMHAIFVSGLRPFLHRFPFNMFGEFGHQVWCRRAKNFRKLAKCNNALKQSTYHQQLMFSGRWEFLPWGLDFQVFFKQCPPRGGMVGGLGWGERCPRGPSRAPQPLISWVRQLIKRVVPSIYRIMPLVKRVMPLINRKISVTKEGQAPDIFLGKC